MHRRAETKKYFVYLRKSSEGKDRQALSIPAQKDNLTEQFGHLNLEFVEESKSAFKPENRPEFARMLDRLRRSKNVGLIAWHPDRLSRNERDAGEITYMIRTGAIADLKFGTYYFENTPEGIWMLQIALSQSQYESAKKGRDVKRGLMKKCQLGQYPAPAPLGYINVENPKTKVKTIEKDRDRFALCRKLVDMMLAGAHTPPQIWRIATNDWAMTGPKGRPVSRSNVYRLFTNPFYYGEFEYPVGTGQWHRGTHVPLMTRGEFDKIQLLLNRPSQTRSKRHDFAYRGPLRCGQCRALITAERKTKRQQNGNVHHYTYYHCTKRVDPDCTEKAVREEQLEEQIVRVLGSIQIPPEFRLWATEELVRIEAEDPDERRKVREAQEREYRACERKIETLIDMRINSEVSEDQFMKRKRNLDQRKLRLEGNLDKPSEVVDEWAAFIAERLRFAEIAAATFKQAGLSGRKQIFANLGSNLYLSRKELVFTWDSVLDFLMSEAKGIRALHERLEPPKGVDRQGFFAKLYAKNPSLLRALHKVRTCRLRQVHKARATKRG